MALKFRPVQKRIEELTTDEIRAWLAGQSDSVVMRSIVIAEVEAVRAGEPRERRTMRGLWYDRVKPLLSRAGILNDLTRGGKPIPWDAKLSKYLAELVRMNFTSYEELLIIDGSRQRQPAREITTGLIDVQLVGAHFPWVILFTEKDTIWGELQSLSDLYGVSAISGGGEPSAACTENTVRAIVRSEAFKREQPESLVILSLTDYDPYGYHIAAAQENQIFESVRALDSGEMGALHKLNHVRLGLQPDQLSPAERMANAYEPKDIGLEDWYKKTGGVDGQPLGLELDSLPLSRLRRMFAQGIEEHIDLGKRRQDLRDAFIDLMACNLLLPEFEKRRQAMGEAVRANGLWGEIGKAYIPDDIFLEAAIKGADWITPVQTLDLFDEHKESVIAAMRAALEG